MTEQEIREDEVAQEEHRTAWIEAKYEVMGWWSYDRQRANTAKND